MAKKVRSINLLRHQEKKIIDKFLDWAFTVGRAIVIITESIALSAFAYRFVLDRQIIDLKDKIKTEQAIIKNSEANERTFRNLQTRLSTAKTLDEQATSKTEILGKVITIASGRMSFRSLSITDKGISMEGIVPSAATVSVFANELKQMPGISKVFIGDILNNTATGTITVAVQAEFAQPETPDMMAPPTEMAPPGQMAPPTEMAPPAGAAPGIAP